MFTEIYSRYRAGVFIAFVVVFFALALLTTSPAAIDRLEVRLTQPLPTPQGEIEVERNVPVTCEWELRNTGLNTFENIRLAVGCACEIEKLPPKQLEPGETCCVSVRLSPPLAGIAQRRIPVFLGDSSVPCVELLVNMRVKVSTPSWLSPLSEVEMTGVAGADFRREFVWHAVEESHTSRWIRDASIESLSESTMFTAHLDMDESPWKEDESYCLRAYRISFDASDPVAGTYAGQLRLRESVTNHEQILSWRVNIVPVLSVIPENLALSTEVASKRKAVVRVVSRVPGNSVLNANFRSELITVQQVRETGTVREFEIKLCEGVSINEPVETEIRFESNGLAPAIVKVRAAP